MSEEGKRFLEEREKKTFSSFALFLFLVLGISLVSSGIGGGIFTLIPFKASNYVFLRGPVSLSHKVQSLDKDGKLNETISVSEHAENGKSETVEGNVIQLVLGQNNLMSIQDGEFEDPTLNEGSYLIAEVVEKSEQQEGEDKIADPSPNHNDTQQTVKKVIVTEFMDKLEGLRGLDYFKNIEKDEEGPTTVKRAKKGVGHIIYVKENSGMPSQQSMGKRGEGFPQTVSSTSAQEDNQIMWTIRKKANLADRKSKKTDYHEDQPAVRSLVRGRKVGSSQ